jgi:hypothetical protein
MWRCVECNSTDVELLAWANMNTGEISEFTDDLSGGFCNDCNDNTQIYFEDDEEDQQINYEKTD